jgi:hypothetical protein
MVLMDAFISMDQKSMQTQLIVTRENQKVSNAQKEKTSNRNM